MCMVLLALLSIQLPGCALKGGMGSAKNKEQVQRIRSSGTVLPKFQMYEEITITREKVVLTRRGKSVPSSIPAGQWEIVLDEKTANAFFTDLESLDYSHITRIEPDIPPLGGGTKVYDISLRTGEKIHMFFEAGTTYTNSKCIVDRINTFINSLPLPHFF